MHALKQRKIHGAPRSYISVRSFCGFVEPSCSLRPSYFIRLSVHSTNTSLIPGRSQTDHCHLQFKLNLTGEKLPSKICAGFCIGVSFFENECKRHHIIIPQWK
ncbi:hypothetical protein VTL71DRAFT_16578 [Oculimacula yallundae]|uniref:Uncharacterized protein n=1 Tax=Oculimacula yallundae TaxID=86028 RepID=A0ABR4CEV6_9HELO